MTEPLKTQELYKVEYLLLLSQLKHLVALARTRDPNMAFIALFGSNCPA